MSWAHSHFEVRPGVNANLLRADHAQRSPDAQVRWAPRGQHLPGASVLFGGRAFA